MVLISLWYHHALSADAHQFWLRLVTDCGGHDSTKTLARRGDKAEKRDSVEEETHSEVAAPLPLAKMPEAPLR